MPHADVNDIRMYYEGLDGSAALALVAVEPNDNNARAVIAHEIADLEKMERERPQELVVQTAHPETGAPDCRWRRLGGISSQMVDIQMNVPNAELLLINRAPLEVQFTYPWIVGPQVREVLQRNSSVLADVSRA